MSVLKMGFLGIIFCFSIRVHATEVVDYETEINDALYDVITCNGVDVLPVGSSLGNMIGYYWIHVPYQQSAFYNDSILPVIKSIQENKINGSIEGAPEYLLLVQTLSNDYEFSKCKPVVVDDFFNRLLATLEAVRFAN